MASTSFEGKSSSTVLGKAVYNWEIEGFNGPLKDLMESRSWCLVDVGDVSLRFHLRYIEIVSDNLHTFCKKSKKFISIRKACKKCKNCRSVSLPETPLLPTGVNCSGYMLLVDVLSSQKQLTFGVSAKILERKSYETQNQLVLLEPGASRTNLVAIENFYCTARWTLDKKGNIKNYQRTRSDTADEKFQLTVRVYEVNFADNSGKLPEKVSERMGHKKNAKCQKNSNIKPEAETEVKEKVAEKSESPVVILYTDDQKFLKVKKSLLKRYTTWFEEHLQNIPDDEPKIIPVRISEEPLKHMLHWMETGNHLPETGCWMREIYGASKEMNILGFLESVDKCVGLFCTKENMHELHDFTVEYKLEKAQSEICKFVKQIQEAEYLEKRKKEKVAMMCTY